MINILNNYDNEMARMGKKYANRDIWELDIEGKVDAIASWFAFEKNYGTCITKCGLIERMALMMEWASMSSADGLMTKEENLVFHIVAQYTINDVLSKQVMKELLKNDVFTKNEYEGWVKCEGKDFKYYITDCGSYFKVKVGRMFVSTTFNVFKMDLNEYKENEKVIVAVC